MHCEIKNQIIQYNFKAKYVLHLCNIFFFCCIFI